jgi:hypothetical protein
MTFPAFFWWCFWTSRCTSVKPSPGLSRIYSMPSAATAAIETDDTTLMRSVVQLLANGLAVLKSWSSLERVGMILSYVMPLNTRRVFTMSWTVGTLIVLCCQIVALVTSPARPGAQNVVLIGPTQVVFPALAVNLLILWLLIRVGRKTDGGKFGRLGGSARVATTGLLGSFLTIFAITITVNLLIANITHFSR